VDWTAEHLGGARTLHWMWRNLRRFGCCSSLCRHHRYRRASGETLAGPVRALLTLVTENWVD